MPHDHHDHTGVTFTEAVTPFHHHLHGDPSSEPAEHISDVRESAEHVEGHNHVMSMHDMTGNEGGMHTGHKHGGMAHDMSDPGMAASMEADIRTRFWVALVLSIVIVLLSPMSAMFGIHLPLSSAVRSWTLLVLTTPVVFWGGWIFISGAYHALRNRSLDMSVLIAVGVLAAYLASVYLTVIGSKDLFYEAAAMLITFVLFGHWMEMKSRRGTNDALKALFNLVPPKARVLREGKESEILTAEVVRGDLVLVRPGDRVPVDGEVTEGETAVDEALVTGESLPVEKKPGDKVIGGSVNGAGAVTIRATAVGEDATLSRIARLVETAQNSKAPGQRLADRAAAYLVVVAVDGKAVAAVGVTDPIKPSARRAIAELKKQGIETAMVSGDNKSVAEAVAKDVGIERVFAEVLPENKADYVKKLQGEGKFVAMVGDGVNDAPALATADIGIAIGAGTDVAIEAAKIVLMQSDPLDILNAIILSKATVRKMKQNLVWASIYNVLAIPVAAGAFYHWLGWALRPEFSALLMSASSIIVAVNVVMLRRSEGSLLISSK